MLFNNTQPSGVVNAATPIPYGVDVTHLIIGKVEWNPAGPETVSIWVDPTDVSSEAAAGAPYITANTFELTSFNSIRLFSGNNANNANDPSLNKNAVSADYDEIRIGDSWDAIRTIVPEPTTLVISLLGLAGLAAVRRRVA